jgi:glyoxylase-like metal-dependent hydrolase (beta-lactamase superfamily II)
MAIMDATKALRMGPTNCYLLNSLGGYLLIDTSLPEYLQPFLRELKKVNVDLSEIRYLLLTHSHDDHAGFAAEIKEKTNCRIIVHKNAIDSLKEGCIIKVGRFLDWRAHIVMSLYNWAKRRNFEYSPVTLDDKDIVVAGDDRDILRTIGVDGRIVYTPGHTDDGISVILANGDAFVGDVCMSNLSFLHYRPIEICDLDLVFESWQKIIEDGAKTIHPGHGKPFSIEALMHYKKIFAP